MATTESESESATGRSRTVALAADGYRGLVPDDHAVQTLRERVTRSKAASKVYNAHRGNAGRPKAAVIAQVLRETDLIARRVYGGRIIDHRYGDRTWHFREFNSLRARSGTYNPTSQREADIVHETLYRELGGSVLLAGDAWDDNLADVYRAINGPDALGGFADE